MKMALIPTIISSLLFFFIGQIVNASEDDRKKWNRRYDAMEYIYGKEPIKFLKENVSILTKG